MNGWARGKNDYSQSARMDQSRAGTLVYEACTLALDFYDKPVSTATLIDPSSRLTSCVRLDSAAQWPPNCPDAQRSCPLRNGRDEADLQPKQLILRMSEDEIPTLEGTDCFQFDRSGENARG